MDLDIGDNRQQQDISIGDNRKSKKYIRFKSKIKEYFNSDNRNIIFKLLVIKFKNIYNRAINIGRYIVNYLKSYVECNTLSDTELDDLAPVDDSDKSNKYIQTLDWALKNDNIHNIALTGPYGSGKSSILNTYRKKRTCYKFLNISLAAFSQVDEKGDLIVDYKFDDIEKGILQQLFYKVRNSKIPYSRFKKLYNISFIKLFVEIIIFMVTVVSGIILFYPAILEWMKVNFSVINEYIQNKWLLGLLYTGFGVLVVSEIAFAIRYLGVRMNVSKISIKELELSKKTADNDSIFDKYLDEILYYFEVTKYNVVFIEDLDRMKNEKIFIKLRELNNLLNNSEQINRKIVFIYAVKDDIFSSKERTKFFDFIIPVIPVIDATNSNEILLEKLSHKDGLSNEFINGVSVYIDDMRVLINICNEYDIYENILTDIDLKKYKLFSIIIYKNLYPSDFAKLQYKDGLVYEAFQGKRNFINSKVSKINIEIENLQKKLNNIESDCLCNLKELKAALIYNMAKPPSIYTIKAIETDRQHTYSIDTIMNENFDLSIFKDKELTIEYNYGNDTTSSLEEADKKSGSEKTYLERWQYLMGMSTKKKNELKERISQCTEKINSLLSSSLESLINDYGAESVLSKDVFEKKPIVYLLRHGYIDETYKNYLTYFYPNSLTADDMNFIISVKDHKLLEYSYELTNIEQIIKRLNIYDFEQKEILNFDLFKYLLEYDYKYKDYISKIISQFNFSCEKFGTLERDKISFLKAFLAGGLYNYKIEFIKLLCKNWHEIWKVLKLTGSLKSKEEETEYLKMIILFADCEDICKIEECSKNINNDDINVYDYIDLSGFILELPNFLSIVRGSGLQKIKEVISKLNLKFNKIKYEEKDKEVFDFIFDNNFYCINQHMIRLALQIKGKDGDNNFEVSNYTVIKQSQYEPLINYIENNLAYYIEEIFSKLPNNIHEDVDNILELLSKEPDILNDDIKRRIICKEEFLLDHIEKINNELWDTIVKENKISASWNNLIVYFEKDNKCTELLEHFIEINCEKLLIEELDYDDYSDKTKKALARELLYSKLPNDCYEAIIKKLNIALNDVKISNIDEEHMKILIKNKYFKLSSSLFDDLKEQYDDNVHIDYVLSYEEEFISKLNEYNVESKDILLILNSELDQSKKIELANKISISLIDEEIARLILNTQNSNTPINREVFNCIWNILDKNNERVGLLVNQINNMKDSDITNYLNKLGGKFEEITKSRKRVKIEYSELIFELAEQLKKKNYISSNDIINKDNIKYVQFNTPNRD